MINAINRTFVIGSKWLYYKIYCGVKTADTLLVEIIKPLTRHLLEKGFIDKWFFIRYADPKPHIRFRLKLIDIGKIEEVIQIIKNLLDPHINSYEIWDVQISSYNRELERYGANSIVNTELFFYYDSCQIISIVEMSQNDEIRFLNMFHWLELLIFSFHLKNAEVLTFLEKLQKQFQKEFEVNRTTRKQLSNKYRKLEFQILDEEHKNFIYKKDLEKIVERFLILNKDKKLEISVTNLLASFIHMSINRCFRSKQRMYEMMLYDFLYRKYKSIYIRYENK
ncbi:thiopeptide-type bacteriocin biosynthesis protein [Polaribacter sp. Z022]|uniref:thiopeptide-type bacteriocin biosynthesis protein n=1 Tax=Polaribacter sp. Z022 TaxID=2927125 RepID=UPI002020F5D0|nr:thiopeptide-type bacteriocin biosynthesis protein [Polaribacter sp. Z022]MCL7752467.1 thiopeptide-type bacteriocin biosynthesis protein [Polaribacter sp. Z022]